MVTGEVPRDGAVILGVLVETRVKCCEASREGGRLGFKGSVCMCVRVCACACAYACTHLWNIRDILGVEVLGVLGSLG